MSATSAQTAGAPRAERVELARPRWVRSGAPGLPASMLALAGVLSFAAASLIDFRSPAQRSLLGLFDCPFRAATGLPCLGCGATHAFAALARARVLDALAANPLWALVALALWTHALVTFARWAGLRWTLALPALSPAQARRARLGLFVLASANWAFVALRM